MRKLTLAQVKALAKKNPDGVVIELYPSKFAPNGLWFSGYPVKVEVLKNQLAYRNSEDELVDFEILLGYFMNYNCSTETGKRVHYYLIEELG
jgi:hypothetical protein